MFFVIEAPFSLLTLVRVKLTEVNQLTTRGGTEVLSLQGVPWRPGLRDTGGELHVEWFLTI